MHRDEFHCFVRLPRWYPRLLRKDDGGARVCGCQCHEDPKPAPPSDVMDFVQAFRRVFLACIPHPIEPDWDPVYAPRLAGFPVNICYASLRGESGPEYATYYFDPRAPSQKTQTSEECGTTRETRVHSGSRWSAARATDTARLANTAEKNWYAWLPVGIFRKAIIHTTIAGLAEDEPADERN
jgi:hypothetical protein